MEVNIVTEFTKAWKNDFPDADLPKEAIDIIRHCQTHLQNVISDHDLRSGPAMISKTTKLEQKLQKSLMKHRTEQRKEQFIIRQLESMNNMLQLAKTKSKSASTDLNETGQNEEDRRLRSTSDGITKYANHQNLSSSINHDRLDMNNSAPRLPRPRSTMENSLTGHLSLSLESKSDNQESRIPVENGDYAVMKRSASAKPPAVKPKPKLLSNKGMKQMFSKLKSEKHNSEEAIDITTEQQCAEKTSEKTKKSMIQRNSADDELLYDLKRSIKHRSVLSSEASESCEDSGSDAAAANRSSRLSDQSGLIQSRHIYEDLPDVDPQPDPNDIDLYEDIEAICNSEVAQKPDDDKEEEEDEEDIYSCVNPVFAERDSCISTETDVSETPDPNDQSPMLAASNAFTVYNAKIVENDLYDNVSDMEIAAAVNAECLSTDDDDDDDEIYSMYASLHLLSKKTKEEIDPSMLYVDRSQIRNRKREKLKCGKVPQTLHQRLSVDCTNLAESDAERCDSTESIDVLQSMMNTMKPTDEESFYQDPDELDAPTERVLVEQETPETQVESVDIRKIIVTQLLDSESQYLDCLRTLLQYQNSLATTTNPVITQEQIKIIFYGIPTLYELHRKFAENLENQLKDWTLQQVVAAPIKELVLFELEIVKSYVKNYHTAVSEVDRLVIENEIFRSIAEEVTVKGDREEKETLRDLLFKPVVRLQRNSLTLKDLLKQTPVNHPDRKELESSMKLIGNFLEEVDVFLPESQSPERPIGNERILVRNSLMVEQVHGSRKLRHLFLFSDVLVCAKPKQGKQNKCTFEVKWFIPLAETADMGETLKSIAGDPDAVHNSRQNVLRPKSRRPSDRTLVDEDLETKNKQDVESLRKKVKQYKHELKYEIDKEDQAGRGDKVWSMVSSKVDRLRKKLIEAKCNLVLASPTLAFKVTNKHGKAYTLLMTSDYERDEWREAIAVTQKKVFNESSKSFSVARPRQNYFSVFEVQSLINSCRQIKVNNLGTILIQEGKDEEVINGMLNVTIHHIENMKEPAATYCTLEVDSFGQFSVLARTNTIVGNPYWNQDFELPLDSSQTLRVLCYHQTSADQDNLIGRGALELSKSWLSRNYVKYTINLQQAVNVVVSVKYTSSSNTIKRNVSKIKSALFGTPLGRITARERNDVPSVVKACVREIETRGMDEVGIYRVSGVTSDIQNLKKQLDKNVSIGLKQLTLADINAVTGLIKLYFRELPESLFTDNLYINFVQGQGLVDPAAKERCMLALFKQLPEPNYHTALFILRHLVNVSDKDDINKMTTQNLATVFGPTLLRPAVPETEDTSPLAMLSATKSMMSQSSILLTFLEMIKAGKDFSCEDSLSRPTRENLI
ncbi:active breakpoint cluster region-related protein-like [Tubulanus polymorphus]|uniref:active breakpoint cluster region-related protein-like n=1 Tax=Tubulanus polymorphus TaxID=672921 RepID=UPI003DA31A51